MYSVQGFGCGTYLKGGLGVSQDGVPLEESKESMEASGFFKVMWGDPIERSIVIGGLYWGPILENGHIGSMQELGGGLTSTRSAAIDMHSCLLSKLLGNCALRALKPLLGVGLDERL